MKTPLAIVALVLLGSVFYANAGPAGLYYNPAGVVYAAGGSVTDRERQQL